MPRTNRSKYNFSKLEMNSTMVIKPLDLYSMQNSLRFYNKKHGKNVIVETEEQADGTILVTRVSAKVKAKN